MFRMRLFFFSLLICPFLFSEGGADPFEKHKDYQSTDVSLFEGLPNGIVNGCVCVITGGYFDQVLDLKTPGHESLTYSRTYSSLSPSGKFCVGWFDNHQDRIITYSTEKDGKPVIEAALTRANGAIHSFSKMKSKNDMRLSAFFLNLEYPKGATNGPEEMGGRYNIKNTTVAFLPEKKVFHVVDGEGSASLFEKVGKEEGYPSFYQTSKQQLNGLSIKYKRDHSDQVLANKIELITTSSKKKHAFFKLSAKGKRHKDHVYTVTSSDGRSVNYHMFIGKIKTKESDKDLKINKIAYLWKVEKNHAPHEKYSYEKNTKNDISRIKKKEISDHCYLDIDYYHKGVNHADKQQIEIKEKEDYRVDRVKSLSAPVGHGKSPHIIQTFIYNAHIHKNRHGEEEHWEGETEVYDAYHHKMIYEYNRQHRLTKIHKFLGIKEYSPYTTEKFFWGADNTSDEGNLLGKALFIGTHSHVYSAHHFEYDGKGNVFKKQYFGNLTGNQPNLFPLDEKHLPKHPQECEEKTYTYSQDGLNLLTSETDSNGNITYYFYKEGTDQLTSKFLVYNHRIQIREFYEKNDDNFIRKKIVDNGSSNNILDMSHVTERKIIYYHPGTEFPFLAFAIEEKYLDLQTQQEVLIKRTDFDYDSQGHLREKRTLDNQANVIYKETFEYDAHGNVTKEVNPLGEEVIKEYDDNNNLIRQEAVGSNYFIKNIYDYSNRLVSQEENHNGNLFTTKNKFNYLSQKISSTDTYGNETEYEYNEFGLNTKMILPSVSDENGKLVTPVILTEYDYGGYPCSITDAQGKKKTIKNTARGKPYHILYPDGCEEKMIYKLDGQLLQKTARDGSKTVYEYDGQNRITSEKVYGSDNQLFKSIIRTYDAFHLLSETDAEGLTIRYEYDFAGRLVKTFKNETLVQQFSYDKLGRICTAQDFYGRGPNDYRLTHKSYDFLNRIIEEKVLSADGKILSYSAFQYDRLGNKVRVQEGEQITHTTFNTDGKPTRIENGLGHITNIVYDMKFINEHGQTVLQTIVTDPLGNMTIETYDTANRLVQSQKKNALGELLSNQKIFYDRSGNRVRVTDDVIYNNHIEKSIQTLFTYTADNQISLMIEADGTPEQRTTSYQYNCLGQKIAKMKPDGVQILYEYDSIGRLKALKSSDHSLHYVYEYNLRDQVTKIDDLLSHTSTSRVYNQLGQLEKEILGNGLKISQTCDLFDRPLSFLLPDNTKIEYVYDASHLKEIHRIVDDVNTYSHHNLEHNLSNQLRHVKLAGEAGTLHYSHDKLGRCIEIRSNVLSQTVPSDGYDCAGNLLKYHSENQLYHFSYDDLYQLKSENGHRQHIYQYDSLQNRRLKDNVIHELNHLNQLVSRGKEQFRYDANGNLIKKVIGNTVTTYQYDALDRLIGVFCKGSQTTYQYDAYHRRLAKKQDGKSDILFIYQGQEEIGSWQNGTLAQLKILNQSQRKSAVIELNKVAYIPTQDLFGNVVVLSDLKGNVIERYKYSSFGEVEIFDKDGEKIKHSAVDNPWQYSNKRVDQESGFSAFGLRYYDPDLGRWTSPDPAGFEDGANLYAYVHNNPLRYFDLLGLFAQVERQKGSFEGFLSAFNFLDNYFSKLVMNLGNLFTRQPTDFSNIKSHPCSLNDTINSQSGDYYNHQETPGMLTMFINGILNSYSGFKESLSYLGGMSDHNINGIYSSSFGVLSDLVCSGAALFFGVTYEPSRLLQKQWNEFFQNNSEDAMIHVICHSRGAIYVRNALRSYPPELRDRIVVTAVAPGAYIDKELCRNVQHYVSSDPVPWIDIIGRFRCQDTIVRMKPAPTALKALDHSFTSDTYAPYLLERIVKFNNKDF